MGLAGRIPDNQSVVQIELKNAKERAAQLGWKVIVDDPGSDQNRQLNTINSWVAQHFPTLIVIALDTGPFQNIVAEARAKGTKIMTYGASLPGEAGLLAINNVPGGRVLGEIRRAVDKTKTRATRRRLQFSGLVKPSGAGIVGKGSSTA